VLRGWRAYFRHGTSKQTFSYLRAYTWRRVVQWLRRKYPKANWRWLRRHLLPGWWPTHEDIELFNPGSVAVSRYRYRGAKIPVPWEGDGREAAVGLEQLQLLIAG
jgi:RNA-directed DNA polymerase